jgi:hypothetical protein
LPGGFGEKGGLNFAELEDDVGESPISSLPETLWSIGSGIAKKIDFEHACLELYQ